MAGGPESPLMTEYAHWRDQGLVSVPVAGPRTGEPFSPLSFH